MPRDGVVRATLNVCYHALAVRLQGRQQLTQHAVHISQTASVEAVQQRLRRQPGPGGEWGTYIFDVDARDGRALGQVSKHCHGGQGKATHHLREATESLGRRAIEGGGTLKVWRLRKGIS